MSRTRVAVLRGGPSEEYEVSLRTGTSVLESIDTAEFEPIDIIVTQGGEWLHEGRARLPEHIIPAVDVVFIALHGSYGEDGTVQRMLDRYSVPYTGSEAYASGLAMHKAYAKDHLKATGILFPEHVTIRKDDNVGAHTHANHIRTHFGPKYVIKPVASGSSIGVALVMNTLELGSAIERALATNAEILVEEYIEGKELTCGVIERFRDHEVYALPPIEIRLATKSQFFDYEAKYTGTTEEICPAQLKRHEKDAIESASKLVHKELNLRQYSRSDFILTPNGLYFLEVNTLPGLTKESLFPKALTAVGSSHKEFIAHLIKDAMHNC
jgi:D-alanine-D-alanine ligase